MTPLVHASSQGPYITGAGADNAGTGSTAWSNTGNITANDGVAASQSLAANGGIGHYLVATGFGFNIPTAGTITGISVDVYAKDSPVAANYVVRDNSIRIVKGGAIQTTEYSTSSAWQQGSSTWQDKSYSNGLWGTTWTPADINSSGFGFAISALNVKLGGGGSTATIQVDYITITVSFTVPPTYLSQNTWRLYNNVDTTAGAQTIDVDTPLAAQNTAATIPASGVFRLRVDLAVSNYQLDPIDGDQLTLGYALRSTTDNLCDTSRNYETYSRVTDTSPISFYNNPIAVNGLGLAVNSNDPTDGTNTPYSSPGLVRQTYQEAGTSTFTPTTLTPTGSDAMWDFALQVGPGAYAGQHYCLLMFVGGQYLNAYTSVAEVVIPPVVLSQGPSRWYNNQTPSSTTYIRTWGGANDECYYNDPKCSIKNTSDGGFITAGGTDSFGAGGKDAYLAKYDSSGNLSWSRTWGGTNYDYANDVVQTTDGGYAITGWTGLGNGGMFIAKYDSSGTMSWSHTWSVNASGSGSSIAQTSDGGYVITGNCASGSGGRAMFLAKYTSTGTLSWSTTWGGGTGDDEGNDVIQTNDGGYAVTGFTTSYGAGFSDVFLAKYDSTGTLSWSRTWGSSSYTEYGYSLVQTSGDFGYVIAANGNNGGTALVKFDSTGSISWATNVNDSGVALSLVQTSDGGFATAGTNELNYNSKYVDASLAKFTSTGTLSWYSSWGGTSEDMAASLVQTSDGGFAVVGTTSNYGAGGIDMFLAKFDSSGSISQCPDCATLSPTSASASATVNSPTAATGTPTVTTMTDGANKNYTSTRKSDTIGGGADYTSSQSYIAPAADVGTPIASINKAANITKLATPYRLRLAIQERSAGTARSGLSFKLQYARQSGGTCTTTPAANYADITNSTPLQFYSQSALPNGNVTMANANDPTDSGSAMDMQPVVSANPFSNNQSMISANEDGLWDFSLSMPAGTQPGTDICVRVVTSSGSTLSSYNYLAEIIYGAQTKNIMRNEKFFNASGSFNGYFLGGKR